MNDSRSKNMMISPGLLPTESLLDSLVLITNEIGSIEKLPLVHKSNVSSMIRRIKLLSSLFEEIQESETQLPPSSILCFTELLSVITRVKVLIQECKDGSSLWSLMQLDSISSQFYVLVKEMGRALDILPLNLLNVTFDIKEQIELLNKQAKRGELFIDAKEFQRREMILEVMSNNNVQNKKNSNNKGFIDFVKVEEIMSSIGLRNLSDYVDEISKLEVEAQNQAGTEWINSGHHTCPKSGQRLIHTALIPNYALKSLVHQWCYENNVTLNDSISNVNNNKRNKKNEHAAIDHISANKAATDAVKMTAEFLVGKLATGSTDIQRQSAYEIRILAKTGMDNRRIIAEVGAIPFLVTLLASKDSRIQEHVVTALFNLSIYDNNKILIMAAGAVENIVKVLESGKTMEARENAAAAIYSLSMVDDCKVQIGGSTNAIPALIGLLKEGTQIGKRDAATALFNLAVYNPNKISIVKSGGVSLLVELLMDDKAGITDDSLAVLAVLLGCSQGLEEIKNSRGLVPLLIDLLRFGSVKGKENSITLLLGLCKEEGELVARKLLANPRSIPSLQSLAADGSLRARRKADALLRLLNRCCSQPHHSL
ncbi:U-box domain-containing protein 1-like isoform X2 [Cicer arietinum]|uniref:U-box domain-containing protein 1-like isoform X2 n=1 Tax=Cicer arietinum TaxID=3827 RepID=UPI0006410E23